MNNTNMVYLDKFLKSNSKKAVAGRFILALLLGSGVAVAGAVAPGLFRLASRYDYSKNLSKNQIKNAYHKLRNGKFVEIISEKNGQTTVRLTNKGEERIKKYSIGEIKIARPKKWDGKWRLVIFDIPVSPKRNNSARRALREKIKELGFVKIQKSVWALPFECEDEILFVAETYDVLRYIEIITADKLLHEDSLLKFFKLRK